MTRSEAIRGAPRAGALRRRVRAAVRRGPRGAQVLLAAGLRARPRVDEGRRVDRRAREAPRRGADRDLARGRAGARRHRARVGDEPGGAHPRGRRRGARTHHRGAGARRRARKPGAGGDPRWRSRLGRLAVRPARPRARGRHQAPGLRGPRRGDREPARDHHGPFLHSPLLRVAPGRGEGDPRRRRAGRLGAGHGGRGGPGRRGARRRGHPAGWRGEGDGGSEPSGRRRGRGSRRGPRTTN